MLSLSFKLVIYGNKRKMSKVYYFSPESIVAYFSCCSRIACLDPSMSVGQNTCLGTVEIILIATLVWISIDPSGNAPLKKIRH